MKKSVGVLLIFIVIAIIAFFGANSYLKSEQSKPTTSQSTAVAKDSETKKPATASTTTPVVEPDGSVRIGNITTSLQGKTITTSGIAKNVTEAKDTIFFDLYDKKTNDSIKGVMFRKTNKDNEGRADLLRSGKTVKVQGEIDVYKGSLEIKVWKVWTP